MPGKRGIIELWCAGNGKYYYHKKAGNGEVVSDGSQGYKQKRYAKVAIKREHPGLKIIELED